METKGNIQHATDLYIKKTQWLCTAVYNAETLGKVSSNSASNA